MMAEIQRSKDIGSIKGWRETSLPGSLKIPIGASSRHCANALEPTTLTGLGTRKQTESFGLGTAHDRGEANLPFSEEFRR